ncbi:MULTISPECIES: quinone-dependent dihydroorotate dehydrogenase [unclassified Sphingomonas]|uniref:quinone-dependent dihydroorotate dehydrogenase n=1 Tax=unclassified Sphingomonas TaxID=196159 RepID=UPI0004498026|nr:MULTISPECIES: quinone-dependent dihydroorotate dehydrogenase [unclassified Sphingomonas]EZP52620.1 Dihydroorotate dehydrogenase (quinone) [Sphingomonas sp. RIT328]
MSYALRPLLFALDAERAHALTLKALAVRAKLPFPAPRHSPRLATRIGGLAFANPLGVAAGLDKDGVAIDGLFGFGFGAVEIGTLTPVAQAGNPRPRLFRLVADRAVINRMGFNNGGLEAGLARARTASRGAGRLGINVGANKDAADRIADYVAGVTAAAPIADYVTINISSPNTPGLRDLQHGAALDDLLAACTAARGATPLFLKIAPDLDAAALDGIARAAIGHRLDAIILGNTTISRPPLRAPHAGESGGLSGAPLAPLARQRLVDLRSATGGNIALIAAGGIDSGAEAYARIRAGARLVQLYSALVYHGPGLARTILRDLDHLLARDGFADVAAAAG